MNPTKSNLSSYLRDLMFAIAFGSLALFVDVSYFLILFGVLVVSSADEFRRFRYRQWMVARWPTSALASIGWSMAAVLSDWQNGGAGSRIFARLFRVIDFSLGPILVHLVHGLLIFVLLGVLEFGLRRLLRGALGWLQPLNSLEANTSMD